MQKKRKDNQFIKQAFYEGGNTAFRKFVAKEMKYPKEALENSIEGVVQLKIDIGHKGKVVGVKLMKGIGHGCDKEAMRIIRLAKYEVPDNPRKMRVLFHKTIRIQFKMPKEKEAIVEKPIEPEKNVQPQNPSMQIDYMITSKTKKEGSDQDSPQKSSYNYTINF